MPAPDDQKTSTNGSGPLVRLKLDQIQTAASGAQSILDATGQGPTASVEGAPQLVLDEVFGRSLRFSGAEDAVVIDLAEVPPESKDAGFTLAIWVKPGQAKEPATVVSVAGDNPSWWALRISDRVEFLWRSNRPQPRRDADRSEIEAEQSWNKLPSPDALAIDEWTHVTVSASANEVRLFINGTRVNEAICDGGLPWSSHGPVVLGHNEQLETKLFGLRRIIAHPDETEFRKFYPDEAQRNFMVERMRTDVRTVFAEEGYREPTLIVHTAGGYWKRQWDGELIDFLDYDLLSLYVLPREGYLWGGETQPDYSGPKRHGLSKLSEISGPCRSIAFDGKSVWAFGTDSDVFGLDEEDGEPVPWEIGPAASIAFDQVSSSFLVAKDNSVYSFEFEEGLLRPLNGPHNSLFAMEHEASVFSIVTPPKKLETAGGQSVGWATACEDGTVHLWGWNLNSSGHHHGLPQPLRDEGDNPIVLHHDGLRAVAFSEDGRMLVTGSEHGDARLWETTTGKPVCDLEGSEVVIAHDAAITAVTFGFGGLSPGVRVLFVVTAGAGGTVRVWDVEALQGHHQPFQGDLSNLRLYPKALKQDEIQAAILKDLPEIQVGTIFPLDFSLHNDQQQHVLYLTDEAQQLHLDVTNVGRRNVMLPTGNGNGNGKTNDEGNVAAPTESTLEIRFRPGTLRPESKIALAPPDADQARKLGHVDDSANWELTQTRDPDGSDVIHLARKSLASDAGNGAAAAAATTLLPGETLYLTLGGLLANVSLGSHSTRVQLKYRLHYDHDTPLYGSRLHYLRVLNMSDSDVQRGVTGLLSKIDLDIGTDDKYIPKSKIDDGVSTAVGAAKSELQQRIDRLAENVTRLESFAKDQESFDKKEYALMQREYFKHGGPLVAGIVGTPAVLNDGSTTNILKLRIDNRDPGHPAPLGADATFRVYLYDAARPDWSLLQPGDLNSVPDEPSVSDGWQGSKVPEDHSTYIQITKQSTNGSDTFSGVNLTMPMKCSAPTGTAYVVIKSENVGEPDSNGTYFEGWLRVPVERSPIVPQGDSTLARGSLSLIDNAYLGFHHKDEQAGFDPDTPGSAVSIDANGALQIASKDAIGLYPGTQPTGATVPVGTKGLVVKNDVNGAQAALDGGLKATGDIDAVGVMSAARLTVKGDITVEGKVGPQDGLGSYLVPRGAIIMWNGDPRTNIQTPPPGWAICDGTQGTPDLRSRFIVSVGPGDDSQKLSAYELGNNEPYYDRMTQTINNKSKGKGGHEQVQLAMEEMPNHQHGVIEPNNNQGHLHKVSTTGLSGGHGLEKEHWDYQAAILSQEVPVTFDTDYATTGITINEAGGQPQPDGSSVKPHENRPPYYALYFIMKL